MNSVTKPVIPEKLKKELKDLLESLLGELVEKHLGSFAHTVELSSVDLQVSRGECYLQLINTEGGIRTLKLSTGGDDQESFKMINKLKSEFINSDVLNMGEEIFVKQVSSACFSLKIRYTASGYSFTTMGSGGQELTVGLEW